MPDTLFLRDSVAHHARPLRLYRGAVVLMVLSCTADVVYSKLDVPIIL
jgi:hypothetical protein